MSNRTRVMVGWTIALLALSVGTTSAEDAKLTQALDKVLNKYEAGGAVVHARVLELPERVELYARNADKPCTPASNFKLVTTATGLDLFGPQHSFKTYLAKDGDDLWIIGTGDPGAGDWRLSKAHGQTPVTMLENWAKYLKDHGITRIAGDLVYYEGEFEANPIVHPTWPKSWLLQWYAAPVTGLVFNDNCVDITVFPTEDGQPVRYEVMPPVKNIEVINDCKTVKEKGSPGIVKRPGGNIYVLRGTCNAKAELKSKPVEDPGAFFADAFRVQLAKAGIEVAGKIRGSAKPLDGVMPPPSDKILTVYSTPITDVLARINKNSQNLFAECLSKLNGQAFDAKRGRHVPGSWKSGGEAARAFLNRNGIDDTPFHPMDGSGLSPMNRVSAQLLTDVLATMAARPDADVYRASLTAAGVDGSLKDRMTDLKGHVFGKTGYIGGVSSMSGYVKTFQGKWMAVSFVFNNISDKNGDDTDVTAFTKLQDDACRVVAHWPDMQAVPASQSPRTGSKH